jgi:hypothetical protein
MSEDDIEYFYAKNGPIIVKNAYTQRPNEIRGGDYYGYKIIVRIDGNGDELMSWSAYMGLTHWSDERVAKGGDKLPEEAARALFPTFRDYFDDIGVFYN